MPRSADNETMETANERVTMSLYGIGIAIVGIVVVYFAFLADAIAAVSDVANLLGGV